MCGITGFVAPDRREADSGELERVAAGMAATLEHRGPDDCGAWVDPGRGVGLAHARLAVIDLSPHGHEPMVSADQRWVLTFNGEIYNHLELRRRLGSERDFRGDCDAETLAEAIAAWGPRKAVQSADGMFAFAVYDRQRRQLTLARDRVGEKPLYYGWHGRTFLFASELKAFRAYPGFQPEIDPGSMALFLRHSYVPTPRSIYKDVYKLAPGTTLTISAETTARGEPEAYWSLMDVAKSGTAAPLELSEAEAEDELESLLRDTIASRMLSDAPLGAFLSGGIDSSTIVALMQSVSPRPVRTFTIGMSESRYDESGYAAQVAHHLGTDHTGLIVTPSEAQAIIPELPRIYDEPFADSSQIPTALVSRLAGKHVTVALSGDGGDEIFGGYVRYQVGQRVWDGIEIMPSPVRRGLSAGIAAVPAGRWDRLLGPIEKTLPRRLRQARPGEKLHKLADMLRLDRPEPMFERLVSVWQAPSELLPGVREPTTRVNDPAFWGLPGDFVDWMMYTDAVSYLPDDILVKVDRASMWHSLEVRVPYLAPRVIEFGWRLPRAMKIRQGIGKWLLRRVLHRHVPRELVDRPKQGFGIPVGDWLRGPLRGWAEELLGERRLQEQSLFEPGPIRSTWQEHVTGKQDWSAQLWTVLMFQAWYDDTVHAPTASSVDAV